MKLRIKIGKSELEIESNDIKELFAQGGAFTQATKCKLCGSIDLGLEYRKVIAKEGENAGKTFEYYNVKCMDCNGTAQLGEFRGGGMFLKRWEKPQYEQKQEPQQNETMKSWESQRTPF